MIRKIGRYGRAGRVAKVTPGLVFLCWAGIAAAQSSSTQIPVQPWPGTLYPPAPGQTPPPAESWRIQTAPARGNAHIKPINRPPSSMPRSVFYGSPQGAPKYPQGYHTQPGALPGVPGAEQMTTPMPLPGQAPTALPMPKDGPMSNNAAGTTAPQNGKKAAPAKPLMASGKDIPAFANGENFEPGAWSAQVGAFAKKSLAEAYWKKMKSDLAFVRKLQPVYQNVTVSGKSLTRLRVLVGDGSKKTTGNLCQAMKSVGRSCWIDRL